MTAGVFVEADLTLDMLENVEQALGGAHMAAFLAAAVGPYLKGRAKERFQSEGDAASGKWAPLKPATQMIRATHPEWPVGAGHPINKRTGELEAWVAGGTFQAMPTPIGATLKYPGNAPTGELRDKVSTAQRGRENPKTVARPILAVDAQDVIFVTSQLVFYLNAEAGR